MPMNTNPAATCWEKGGLIHPRSGTPLPPLRISTHALRHAFETHPEHLHEGTFGTPLGAELREWLEDNPHGALQAGLLRQAGEALYRDIKAALASLRAMSYRVLGKSFWKMVVILESGAMVPLLVDQAAVTVRSHFFHTRSLGALDPATHREAAACYLVEQNCPTDPMTGAWLMPSPEHWKEVGDPRKGRSEVRHAFDFLSHAVFGFPSAAPGTPRARRPAV
jgi:hypothetical protein